jgi:hypothetical protein
MLFLSLSLSLAPVLKQASFIIGHATCFDSKLTSGMSKGIAIIWLFKFPQLLVVMDGSLKILTFWVTNFSPKFNNFKNNFN